MLTDLTVLRTGVTVWPRQFKMTQQLDATGVMINNLCHAFSCVVWCPYGAGRNCKSGGVTHLEVSDLWSAPSVLWWTGTVINMFVIFSDYSDFMFFVWFLVQCVNTVCRIKNNITIVHGHVTFHQDMIWIWSGYLDTVEATQRCYLHKNTKFDCISPITQLPDDHPVNFSSMF